MELWASETTLLSDATPLFYKGGNWSCGRAILPVIANAGLEPKSSDCMFIGCSVDMHQRVSFRRSELSVWEHPVLIAAQTQTDGLPELFLALIPGPSPW